jgi:hypothetical protein
VTGPEGIPIVLRVPNGSREDQVRPGPGELGRRLCGSVYQGNTCRGSVDVMQHTSTRPLVVSTSRLCLCVLSGQIARAYFEALKQVKAREGDGGGSAADAPDLADRLTAAEDRSHRKEQTPAELLEAFRGLLEEARRRLPDGHPTILRALRDIVSQHVALEDLASTVGPLTEVGPIPTSQ